MYRSLEVPQFGRIFIVYTSLTEKKSQKPSVKVLARVGRSVVSIHSLSNQMLVPMLRNILISFLAFLLSIKTIGYARSSSAVSVRLSEALTNSQRMIKRFSTSFLLTELFVNRKLHQKSALFLNSSVLKIGYSPNCLFTLNCLLLSELNAIDALQGLLDGSRSLPLRSS